MHEVCMMGKKALVGDTIFLLDFEDAPIGSQVLTPKIGNFNFVRKQGGGLLNGVDGVVDDPTHGKCYRFNGATYFEDAVNRWNIWNKPHRLTIKFAQMTTRVMVIFCTGDYDPSPSPGSNLNTNVSPGDYLQVFRCNGSGYVRNYVNGPLEVGKMEDLVLTQTLTEFRMENRRTGKKSVNASFDTRGETFLRIGIGQNTGVNCADMLLKSLRIELL